MPSSIQMFNQAISDFKRLQGSLVQKQALIGADSKASTFAQFGNDINIVQSYQFSIDRSDRYLTSIADAQRKNDTIHQALSQLIEIASTFKQNIALEGSATSGAANNLSQQANAALDNIRGALNTKDGSNYMFSGSKTNVEPVGDMKTLSNMSGSETTASYYNGDNFTMEVDVSASMRISYGINASDPAFQKLIGALNMAKQAEGNNGTGLVEAGAMLDEAINEIITMQARVGDNARIMNNSASAHQSAKANFQEKYDAINSPDIVQLTIEASQAQATLEASFMIFSRMSALNLANYL